MRGWLVILACVASAVAVGACGGSDASDTTGESVAPGVCRDSQAVASTDPPRRNLTALSRIAIQAPPVFQASRWSHHLLFSKIGLWVHGGSPVTVRASRPAKIQGWTAQRPAREVVLLVPEGCGWHAYPGGPLFPPPRRCLALTFEADGKTATLQVGAGKKC